MTTRQPRLLYLLFSTELWERFGFFTVQYIMVLYMTNHLGYSDSKADLVYGVFGSFVYLTPIVGGYLADRYLGFQRAILLGGALLSVGYLVSAIPGVETFYLGLSIVIVANGFFKPNVSSIVGELYEKDDPRRDGGFNIFYMGINIGALLPSLSVPWVRAHFGDQANFYFAALGMLVAFLTFAIGRRWLGHYGAKPGNEAFDSSKFKKTQFYCLLVLGILVSIVIARTAFTIPAFTNIAMIVAMTLVFIFIFILAFKQTDVWRGKMLVSLVLIVISIGYWALYNETFTVLMLFAERNMNPHFLGFYLDPENTQFFNSFYIITISPLLSILWLKLAKFNANPSYPLKFAIAILFMSSGYLLLAIGTSYFGHHGLTSAWWLALSYLLQTLGELFLSPIGLSMLTVLTPRKYIGLMIGIWFGVQVMCNALSSLLATIASVPRHLDAVHSLPIYAHAFWLYTGICFVFAVIAFSLVPTLRKML